VTLSVTLSHEGSLEYVHCLALLPRCDVAVDLHRRLAGRVTEQFLSNPWMHTRSDLDERRCLSLTTGLAEVGAASTITVFGNGLNGPGAMGFQPGIFREKAGLPSWSPLWDHLTAVWKDPSKAVLLRSQADLDARVAAEEIEIFKGTPDTGGQGFVVNCPSPIVAPNDFEVTS